MIFIIYLLNYIAKELSKYSLEILLAWQPIFVHERRPLAGEVEHVVEGLPRRVLHGVKVRGRPHRVLLHHLIDITP